ncbi:hypothetical protein MMC15_008361 [Xylographa vitiligo]|nr:hypothetical protein [Xylographa vitiligo]
MPEFHHEHHPNVSADLIWEIARANNAFLVKRRSGGGVQFSRDPFNLVNKHSRKHAGFVNDKTKHSNRPIANINEVKFGADRSGPKVYKNIVNVTAKQGYRPDLRRDAVARASAIKMSSRPVKETTEKKARGAKAKRAATKE